MIGNLNDFNPEVDKVPLSQLPSVDRYILSVYSELVAEVTAAYDNFQFFRASQAVLKFCSSDLSSFYLDVAKDRLYISASNDFRRRSCQTVFYEITEGLAPVIVQTLGGVIRQLKERGYTIVLVEQNFRFAAPLADRHYVMEGGRIVQSLTAAELESKTDMLHEYLGI